MSYKQRVTGSNPVTPTENQGFMNEKFINPFFLQKICKKTLNKNENIRKRIKKNKEIVYSF
jgi:hypothetical protein